MGDGAAVVALRLAAATTLRSLNLSANDITFESFPALEMLAEAVAAHPGLTSLDLDYNQVGRLSHGSLRAPLWSFRALTASHSQRRHVRGLPRAAHPGLTSLDLSYNQVGPLSTFL